jgi:tetratricopeptide (TPR) repeat protein
MKKIDNYKQDFLMLLESSFIAINQMDEDSANKLLKAAEILDPKNPLIKIGKGYLHLHKLELSKATKYFEEVLKEDPKNEMAKTFLGIALSMTINDMPKGEKMLEDSINSDDKGIKKLAGIALDFIDRFVRKEPSPVEGKKPKSKG